MIEEEKQTLMSDREDLIGLLPPQKALPVIEEVEPGFVLYRNVLPERIALDVYLGRELQAHIWLSKDKQQVTIHRYPDPPCMISGEAIRALAHLLSVQQEALQGESDGKGD